MMSKASLTLMVLLAMTGCNTAPPEHSAAPLEAPAPAASRSATPAGSPRPIAVPQGVAAGIAVYDRKTQAFLAQINDTKRFRSASLVKIFIAIDYLWDRGPGYAVETADQNRFDLMLQGSDDDSASYFYSRIGGEPAINRVITRLGLKDTKPPSAVGLKGWGSTTLSAGDMIRTYQFLLDKAPAGLRDAIMGNLRVSTPCGTDKYYQTFGIPASFSKPWSAKQGWWGFGDAPKDICSPQAPYLPVPAAIPALAGASPALMDGRVLHTTGTAGEGDRLIVAVLTHFPNGTAFTDAYAAITSVTRSLPLPAGVQPFRR